MINKENITYETVEMRKIYPVIKALINDMPNNFVKQLAYASYLHGFYGDLSGYLSINDTQEVRDALKSYTEKFDPYFMADFEWTLHNWNVMKDNEKKYTSWAKYITEIKDSDIILPSITDFIKLSNVNENMSVREVTDRIFDTFWEFYYADIFDNPTDYTVSSQNKQISQRMRRYIYGQMLGFFEYDNKYVPLFKNTLKNVDLGNNTDVFDNLRKHYLTFLYDLSSKAVITLDDYNTYKDLYPMFPPHFVDYDHNIPKCSLKEYTESILCKK